jgi:hypothetical protein
MAVIDFLKFFQRVIEKIKTIDFSTPDKHKMILDKVRKGGEKKISLMPKEYKNVGNRLLDQFIADLNEVMRVNKFHPLEDFSSRIGE